MTPSKRPLMGGVAYSAPRADRITATEVINGVRYRIVLERDGAGHYREVSVTPLDPGAEAGAAGSEVRLQVPRGSVARPSIRPS